MSIPPPLPDSSRWWKRWIAAVAGTPMCVVLGLLAGERLRIDFLFVVGLLFGLIAWCLHIYVTVRLAKAIVVERAALGRKASIEGLVIGLLFGGWAAMFGLFFCGCLAVLMTN